MNHDFRQTIRKIARRLELIQPLVYLQRHALAPFRYRALQEDGAAATPLADGQTDDRDWPLIEPNTYWGRWRTDFVLRSRFQVPGDWDARLPAALYLPLGEAGDFGHPEALVYVDGLPYAACDRHHQEVALPAEWRDGEPHLLALYGWTGRGGSTQGEPGTQLFMRPCAVVQVHQPTRDLMATLRVALAAAESLEESDPARSYLLNTLDQALAILDTREPLGEAFYASVGPAHEALRQGIARAGEPLPVSVVSTGHAHIDVAWLWTLDQSRRKAGRTFHTVARLMEQFPEYHFTQSQPQLYDTVRQDYPALFAEIRQRVAQGRWEPIGGMWVEADCNISGAEALARQFLLGRTFFRKHFGPQAESPVLWLPDVFGFAGNLPQLARQAGLSYFFTIKLSWNRHNRLPYDTFWWQGLDGTRLLTHFGTTPEAGFGATYNGMATPPQALDTWKLYQQKALNRELLMPYGHGDGGGGPTREMLENIREMSAFPGLPRLCQGSVLGFFRKLEATNADRWPTWEGELYLELHRGTYTTQSRNKRANRKSEFRLHDAEFLAALAETLSASYRYPAADLRQAWQLVCLNQFHDIIPGSSITEVYADSQQQYRQVFQTAETVSASALVAIGRAVGGDLLVVNPTAFTRRDLAFWPGRLDAGQILVRPDGTIAPSQATSEGTWIAAGKVTPFNVMPLRIVSQDAASTPPAPPIQEMAPGSRALKASPGLLENAYLRVEINAAGDITRIYDKVNRREVLADGALGNDFQAFEDRPVEWDAWDIDIAYEDKMWTNEPASAIRVVEVGPLRATLEIKRRIGHSDYVQQISVAYNSPRLDFDTTIDWHERHTLLKVAFPVDVLSPKATYEIQYGNIERPTHRNTSWDWAHFENCAQKWVDLSEGGYGVSLLNDCKYGHDIHNNVIRLSLLRGPTAPDPQADQGQHRFVYSLLPHANGWDETTVQAAYALNDPIIVARGTGSERPTGERRSFVSADQPNIVIETIKKAEDGHGFIVRLYESQRRRGPVVLTTGFELGAAWLTNLLEENQEPLNAADNQVRLLIKPYEIVTLRLVPASRAR